MRWQEAMAAVDDGKTENHRHGAHSVDRPYHDDR
jgi:hypothetical protein